MVPSSSPTMYEFLLAILQKGYKKYSPNVGLEPTTVGLRVQRSTDWASRAWIQPFFIQPK